MEPKTLFQILSFLAALVGAAMLAIMSDFQKIRHIPHPIDEASVFIYQSKKTGNILFTYSKNKTPYKYYIGTRLYKGKCRRRHPTAIWESSEKLLLSCGTEATLQSAELSGVLVKIEVR